MRWGAVFCPRCRRGLAWGPGGARCPCGARLRVRRGWRGGASLAAAFALGLGVGGAGMGLWSEAPPVQAAASVTALGHVAPRVEPVWDARAREVRSSLEEEFGRGRLGFLASRPHLVAYEAGEAPPERAAAALSEVHARFLREFRAALGLPEIDGVLPVVLLRREATYRAYQERVHRRPVAAAVTGMYEFSRRRIVLWDSGPEAEASLRHEAVHQLVHCYGGYRHSPDRYWLHEGLAVLFERSAREGDLAPGPQRMGLLRAAAADGRLVPVRELVRWRISDVWDLLSRGEAASVGRAQVAYAQAAGFVHFLYARHRAVFLEALAREIQTGRDDLEVITRRSLGADVASLGLEWEAALGARGGDATAARVR